MPSLVEVSIVVAAFAFVAFVYTLAERYLDLSEAEVHIGVPPARPSCVAGAERVAARLGGTADGRAPAAEQADATPGGTA